MIRRLFESGKAHRLLELFPYLAINLLLWSLLLTLVSPFLDRMPVNNRFSRIIDWQLVSTKKFVDIWLREGIIKNKFRLMEDPDSVEFLRGRYWIWCKATGREPPYSPNWGRLTYPFYPIGHELLIFSIAKLLGLREVSMRFLGIYAFIYQLITVLIFTLILKEFLEGKLKDKLLLFLLVAFGVSLIWFNALFGYAYLFNFFSDLAGLLPLMILLLLRLNGELISKPFGEPLYLAVWLWGVFTDHIFIFLGISLIAFDLLVLLKQRKEKEIFRRDLIFFSFSLLVLISLYLYSYGYYPLLEAFKAKLLVRGVGDKGFYSVFSLYDMLLSDYPIFILEVAFGKIGKYIYLISVISIFFIFSDFLKLIRDGGELGRVLRRDLLIPLFLIFTPVLNLLALPSHTINHWFPFIKISFGISFSIIYITHRLVILIKERFPLIKEGLLIGVFLGLNLIVSYVFGYQLSTSYFNVIFSKNTLMPDYYRELMRVIKLETGYKDIVFSPLIEARTNPPSFLASSLKRIYYVENLSDIASLTRHLGGKDFNIVIILSRYDPSLKTLKSFSFRFISLYRYRILWISNEELSEVLRGEPEVHFLREAPKTLKAYYLPPELALKVTLRSPYIILFSEDKT